MGDGGEGATPRAVSRRDLSLVALVALAFAAHIGWATAPYGPGGWHFAMNNIAAADHLLSGDGLLQSRGNPFLSWPPLLPALIAGLKSCGLRYSEATWWIAIGAALTTMYFHGRLVLELSRSAWLTAFAMAVLWVAPGFVAMMCCTYSQPLFIAITSAGAWLLARWTVAPDLRIAAGLAVLGAAASMHRYDGLVFIAVAFAVMSATPSTRPLLRRVLRAGVTALAAGAPLAAWLLRNRAVSGTWTGERAPGSMSIAEVSADVAQLVERWWIPGSSSADFWRPVLAVALAIVIAAWLLRLLHGSSRHMVSAAAAFPLAYAVALIGMASRVEMDRLSDRLALPIMPSLAAASVLALGCGAFWARARVEVRTWGPRALCGVYLAVQIAANGEALVGLAPRLRSEGAGGFASARWLDTDLARWLRVNPLDGALLSNAPEAVLLGADRMPDLLDEDDWRGAIERSAQPCTLIFSLTRRRDRKLLERVRAEIELTALVELEDGAVYCVASPQR